LARLAATFLVTFDFAFAFVFFAFFAFFAMIDLPIVAAKFPNTHRGIKQD
jgi:hypothetical protein